MVTTTASEAPKTTKIGVKKDTGTVVASKATGVSAKKVPSTPVKTASTAKAMEKLTGVEEKVDAKAEKLAKAEARKSTVQKAQLAGKRTTKGVQIAPSGTALVPAREGSRNAKAIDLMSRKQGATMAELLKAMGPTRNGERSEMDVKTMFSWSLRRRGYGVRTEVSLAGLHTYFLVVPAGQKIPAHTKGGKE